MTLGPCAWYTYSMETSKPIDIEVIPPAKAGIVPEDETGEQALLSRIPLQSGDARKAGYLSWRATGFGVREACDLTPCSHGTLMRWRREDKEFAEFEDKFLQTLQKDVSKDLIHLEFLRNMRLALHRDFKVLWKAAYDLESLTDAETAYLKLIRRIYTPQDLIVLEKAVEPGDDSGTHTVVNAVIIHVDGKRVEDEAARRAAARELLERFEVRPPAPQPEEPSDDGDRDGG